VLIVLRFMIVLSLAVEIGGAWVGWLC